MIDDRELQAAQWVEVRARRLRVMFGSGASLLAAGIFLVAYLSLRDASLEETRRCVARGPGSAGGDCRELASHAPTPRCFQVGRAGSA